MFYSLIDKKGGFDKNSVNKDRLTETEEYCLFKKGELRKDNDGTFCILDGEEKNVDDFFVESLRTDIKPIELDTKKALMNN